MTDVGDEMDAGVVTGAARAPGAIRRSERPTEPTVSVVVPTLNEARNLPFALQRLPDCVTEVIIVDGRSTDGTLDVGAFLRADVRIVQETRKGKGIALQRGFEEATGDIIVMLDADGSADSAEIDAFVDALVGGADFAKGSRFLPGGGSVDLTPIRDFGNRTLTAAVNLVCQTRYTDLCYGYNAFWRDCLEFVPVDVSGFEVETRLNMLVASSGLAVVEVPSHEFSRVYGDSNLRVVQDGTRVLSTIIKTTAEIRSGLKSVRSATDTDPASSATPQRTMFMVAGKAPTWLNEHTRHSAQAMTEHGRVLVGFTDGFARSLMLPGDSGGNTLLSIAPSGYPIWTGRVLASLGIRRHHDNVVIVKFDESRSIFAGVSAAVARLRRERVIVHDVTTPGAQRPSLARRAGNALLNRMAHTTLRLFENPSEPRQCVTYAPVGNDIPMATMLIDGFEAMADDMATHWRLVLHSDDPKVATLAREATRSDITVVTSDEADEIDGIHTSDVVVTRYESSTELVTTANALGVVTIVVDHPVARRVPRLFDGTWLTRFDISALLVALESSRGINEGSTPVTREIRAATATLVEQLSAPPTPAMA